MGQIHRCVWSHILLSKSYRTICLSLKVTQVPLGRFRPAHANGLLTTWSELGTDRRRMFALFYFLESPEVVVLSAVFNCHSGPLASSLHRSAIQTPLSVNEPYYFWPVIATRGPSDFSCSPRVNSHVGGGVDIYIYVRILMRNVSFFGAGWRYVY